jgi:hypothetical protein
MLSEMGFPNQFFNDSWAAIANVDGRCVRQVDAANSSSLPSPRSRHG